MQEALEVGSHAFIIESNRTITEVVVSGRSGDLYTVRFPGRGGIRVRRGRLFPTKEEAESRLPAAAGKKRPRSPYDWQ